MKNQFQKIAILTVTWLAILATFAPKIVNAESEDDILIVANNKVEADAITVDEARAFFLKKRTSWKEGGKIAVINAPKDSILRDVFRSKVLGMDWSHEQSYWQNEGIRKGLSQPPEFSQTLKAVFKIQGSLGYVFRKDFKEGSAKVLLVIER